MLDIFSSILPVFLLVLLGVGLKRAPVISTSFWDGLDQFGYYVLFPSLLFQTLSQADFSAIASGRVMTVTILSVLLTSALTLMLWPALRSKGISRSSFGTMFQTATRWNGFMALAIAEKIDGARGLTVVAVIMAAIIIPINILNVAVLVWFGTGSRHPKQFLIKLVTNPIIIGSALGVAVNLLHIPIYAPVMVALDLVARAALGLGLLMVGAGLRVGDALRPSFSVLLPTVLKLLFFPALMVIVALAFGLRGEIVLMLALSGAVPTAMNGYVLAKQMGGDAPLYAATATIQTLAAFFTIPLVLAVTAYATGG